MENIEKVRHSLSHILAQAVLEFFPKTKLGMGPAIENGFYYDFQFPTPLQENDLEKIEKRMKEIILQNEKFEKEEISKIKAKKLFANQPYKLDLISELPGKTVTIYTNGNFTDLCKGPHIKNTKEINPNSFHLTKIAGAYWKGSEKNKMLTRIYGLAFETPEELTAYSKMMEEAEKRDHRVLGEKLDLFHIDEKVGLGLPLWHPRGAMIWRQIEDFWYQEHIKNDYELVRSPHIGNRTLWETSGHWGFYNASMYPPIEIGQALEEKQKGIKAKESEEYLLKPMNCPFHVQIYKTKPRSYRELPMRWAECGTVYRFEKKGELSGLTRVRGFTQDDAHIICRTDQVEDELKKVVDFILFIFKSFGFDIDNIEVFLSLRDPKNKEKYTGTDRGWKFAEDILRKITIEKKLKFTEEKGEAAFYGPKLDFKLKDVLGRKWQCSTLQFDFNLPERFNMTYINNQGAEERPYMIHRALFGSYERFIALLIEHFAGAFPLWLSPIQVAVIPISEKHLGYAQKIIEELKKNNIRIDFKNENETLGKKIRAVEMQKIPYLLVMGDKEVKTESVSVRERGKGDLGVIKIDEFLEKIKKDIKDKK
jgi:threonyl-tRNA synthetase